MIAQTFQIITPTGLSRLEKQVTSIEKELTKLNDKKTSLEREKASLEYRIRTYPTIENVLREEFVMAIGEQCYVKDTAIVLALEEGGCDMPETREDREKALTALGLVPIYTKDKGLLGWSGIRARE